MVKIDLIVVGKLKENYWKDACAEYLKRLTRFCDLRVKELPERFSLKEESADILRSLRGYAVALAVEGQQLSSEELSLKLGGLCDSGERISFVIGSSCGLDPAVKARADFLLSFSKMTFPHQMMRAVLLEQIYRAFMIRAGAEYHK